MRHHGQRYSWNVVATNEGGKTEGEAGPWTFEIVNAPTPGQCLNTENMDWNTSGATHWFAQSDVTHDGEWAMQSGNIGDGETSALQTTVQGPGVVEFWWRVSSQQEADYLNFYCGDELKGGISGEAQAGDGWIEESFHVPAGQNLLAWKYEKDGSTSAGEDSGWLDQVRWQPIDSIRYPVSGFDDKYVAFYLWDQSQKEWNYLSVEKGPTSVTVENLAPDVWYWLCVMEYNINSGSWSLVHGSWIGSIELAE